MKQPPVVIRKYPNRRLYDTSSGRYVNLDDVAGLIRRGVEVQVVDARTGEDLTRMVLTQIVVEDAKDQPTGLPLELLRQLIMITDQAGQELIMWYLKSAFDAYQKAQETVQTRLTDIGSAAMTPFQMVKNLFTPQAPALPPPPLDEELERLRRRVAELEAHQESARPRPRKSPKRGRTG